MEPEGADSSHGPNSAGTFFFGKSGRSGGRLVAHLKKHFGLIALTAFLALGALGAGLKYLDEDARRVLAERAHGTGNPQPESFFNKINPFLPAPATGPVRLAKEYIYAGSRMLAIEEANAAPAPPADLAVWRPTTGVWWILGGAGSQQFAQAFGQAGDAAAPGDYDGDGKTDLCIFRASTGVWWIVRSSDGGNYSISFGTGSDKIAPADYDGDGKTDIAVYRPSNGTWYILQSSNGITAQAQFGLPSDAPAPKDFDGDGRADIAVWRGSDSTFYSLDSADYETHIYTFNQLTSPSNAVPVPADYDGDGRADYAVRHGADWLILDSAGNQTQIVNWQQAGDVAVPNDYDGDGRVDVAVWRNSNGTWYIRRSAAGGALRQTAWGMAGDIPVPAFYRR